MRKTIWLCFTGLLIVCNSGCASMKTIKSGALLDIDFRTPEQIAASATPQIAVNNVVDASWIQFIPSILEAVKGRIRILSFDCE